VEINSILQRSINLEMYPAAIAACEILKMFGDDAVLSKNSGPYPPLVNAILTGDRNLQFAALDAIRTLDPKHAFAGVSHVVSLAAYLASSYGQPKALIGHHRLDVAQTFAASVASSGVTGDAAMTGRELFEIATSDPDVEVILVSDSITRPSSAILIQQLRSDWRTRKTPIALMFSDLSRRQRALIRFQDDPTVVVLPFASDPSLIAASVDQLVYKVATFRQSRSSRIRHAKVAVQWLERIASDRKTFRFFELGPHQEKLQALIYRPGFAGHVSSILANVATPSAQRQLVNFASQNSLPAKQRQYAAAAFSKAVQQTGVLLTRDEILLQYDRYNASEKESPATQQVLSSILDAIEAKKE
jgi:CheY-like chemotaxis protein